MQAHTLITDLIKEIRLSDSCDYALDWMTENHLCHLPVVENGKFLGIVSDESILDLSDSLLSIKESKVPLLQHFVWAHTHIYDIVRITANARLTIIPVMDKEVNYLGVITMHDVYSKFATISGMTEPGGIIVLEVNTGDFVLSEISRIVESCNGIILSSNVQSNEESTKMNVTLKINLSDLSEVVETFERFDYAVSHSYFESDNKSDLQDRYDSLMKYLNI